MIVEQNIWFGPKMADDNQAQVKQKVVQDKIASLNASKFGIWPEHLEIPQGGESGELPSGFAKRVEAIEYMGGARFVDGWINATQ